jgi:hypothetical protein
MNAVSPLIILFSVWLIGLITHFKWAWQSAGSNESSFWVWIKPPASRMEEWARYSFYAWLVSSLVVFLPVGIELAICIQATFLFAHILVLICRK